MIEAKRPVNKDRSVEQEPKSEGEARQEESLKGDDQSLLQPSDSISTEGLSPEDASAVIELAGELLPFSPIISPRLSSKRECPADDGSTTDTGNR